MKLFKSFLLCLFLNAFAMMTVSGLSPNASQMGLHNLAIAYTMFGYMLLVSSDLLFITRVVAHFRKPK